MLFYEVQLCVQQPSSCYSNVLCCSGNLHEVRGMKDSVSAFHLGFSVLVHHGVLDGARSIKRFGSSLDLSVGLEEQNCSSVLGF